MHGKLECMVQEVVIQHTNPPIIWKDYETPHKI